MKLALDVDKIKKALVDKLTTVKFNPNHDAAGRFATGSGGSGGGVKPKVSSDHAKDPVLQGDNVIGRKRTTGSGIGSGMATGSYYVKSAGSYSSKESIQLGDKVTHSSLKDEGHISAIIHTPKSSVVPAVTQYNISVGKYGTPFSVAIDGKGMKFKGRDEKAKEFYIKKQSYQEIWLQNHGK